MNSLFSYYSFIFSFSFLLASVSILPCVLTEPLTLLTLLHDILFQWLIHPSNSILLCSTTSLLPLAGFLFNYLPQYLCHRCSILLYTPHVSTQFPQPSAGQYTVQSNSTPLNLHRQKTYLLRVIS